MFLRWVAITFKPLNVLSKFCGKYLPSSSGLHNVVASNILNNYLVFKALDFLLMSTQSIPPYLFGKFTASCPINLVLLDHIKFLILSSSFTQTLSGGTLTLAAK